MRTNPTQLLKNLRKHAKRGATAIEYALIGALIVIVIIASLGVYSDSMGNMYANIQTAINPALR